MGDYETNERLTKAHIRSVHADIVATAARAVMYLAIAFAAYTIAVRIAA